MTAVTLRRGDSPNSHYVEIGNVTLFFSYETCVAYRYGSRWIVSENVWSKTTGKHLNELPVNKRDRVRHEDFVSRLDSLLQQLRWSA